MNEKKIAVLLNIIWHYALKVSNEGL